MCVPPYTGQWWTQEPHTAFLFKETFVADHGTLSFPPGSIVKVSGQLFFNQTAEFKSETATLANFTADTDWLQIGNNPTTLGTTVIYLSNAQQAVLPGELAYSDGNGWLNISSQTQNASLITLFTNSLIWLQINQVSSAPITVVHLIATDLAISPGSLAVLDNNRGFLNISNQNLSVNEASDFSNMTQWLEITSTARGAVVVDTSPDFDSSSSDTAGTNSFATYDSLTVGTQIGFFIPDHKQNGGGGEGTLVWTAAPALPAGLSIIQATTAGDTERYEIMGTPTTPSAATSYLLTLTDEGGDFDSVSLTLTIIA